MQTLDPPTLLPPELSIPWCEQVLPGNVPPDTDEGELGGTGPAPEPLQGGGDPESEERQGNEGAGT
ncbi:MAG: hypothetical protein JO036_02335 [Candidatus Eremiobacteraeota bacterium]|nr:hypothetical protein [Candidatus Eremiobacteraeota bacterium]